MARPRKHNPLIPNHIDQTKIPKGVYWDASGNGRWYMLTPNGIKTRETVAGPKARLSDLHKAAEISESPKLTLKVFGERFFETAEFKNLAKSTRDDYRYCHKAICELKTKRGGSVGSLELKRLRPPHIQGIIDRFHNEGHPSKANHSLRYMRRLFDWGIPRGLLETNPARPIKAVKERKRRRLPSHMTFNAVLKFAFESAAKPAHTMGSCAPYLPLALSLAYMMRLRGVEATSITLDLATKDGIRTDRRKGSNDNFVPWTPRLRQIWDAALTLRKKNLGKRPEAIRKEDRYLFLNQSGTPLAKTSFDTAWQRLITRAIKEGVIDERDRFSPHDLKRKGGTEAKGNRGDRQDALGVSDSIMNTYDLSVPTVDSTEAAFEDDSFTEYFTEVIKK